MGENLRYDVDIFVFDVTVISEAIDEGSPNAPAPRAAMRVTAKS